MECNYTRFGFLELFDYIFCHKDDYRDALRILNNLVINDEGYSCYYKDRFMHLMCERMHMNSQVYKTRKSKFITIQEVASQLNMDSFWYSMLNISCSEPYHGEITEKELNKVKEVLLLENGV